MASPVTTAETVDVDTTSPSQYQDDSIIDGEMIDPLEPLNRFTFAVNDYADGAAIKPVAHLYEDVTPEEVRKGVTNFTDNLCFPINFVNFLGQGRFEHAGHSVARFFVNTILGVGGIFDPATEVFGLKKEKTGFGETLGSWGMHAGPYLVLPLYGPSSFRGGIGKAADYFGHPLYLATINKKVHKRHNHHHQYYHWYIGTGIMDAINLRQQYLKTLDDLKAESIDEYEARKSLYTQDVVAKQKQIREDLMKNIEEVEG